MKKEQDVHISLYAPFEVKFREYSDSFDIQMRDFQGKPDLKIGHFGYNLWLRPRMAQKMRAYKNWASVKRAIILCGRAHGLTYEKFIITGHD